MARKTPAAQLDREIVEALSSSKVSHARKPKGARRDSRIASGGQGGFGDPPGYPTHDYHVESQLRRAPGNRGGTSLTYAASQSHIDPETRREAQELLDNWEKNRPPITSLKVQEWIKQVLRHHGEQDGIRQVLKFYPEFTVHLVDQLSDDERVALDAMLANGNGNGNGQRKVEIDKLIPDAGRRKYVKTIADQLK